MANTCANVQRVIIGFDVGTQVCLHQGIDECSHGQLHHNLNVWCKLTHIDTYISDKALVFVCFWQQAQCCGCDVLILLVNDLRWHGWPAANWTSYL